MSDTGTVNCVNCGAPPRRGSRECAYCETPLEVRAPRADHAAFRAVMRAIESFSFDDDRLHAVRGLRGEFTAGQVVRILETFSFDDDRLAAGAHLAPRTINPAMLFAAAELFSFDDDRAQFVRIVGRVQHGDDEPAPTAPLRWVATPQDTRRPPWGVIILAAVLVIFIAERC